MMLNGGAAPAPTPAAEPRSGGGGGRSQPSRPATTRPVPGEPIEREYLIAHQAMAPSAAMPGWLLRAFRFRHAGWPANDEALPVLSGLVLGLCGRRAGPGSHRSPQLARTHLRVALGWNFTGTFTYQVAEASKRRGSPTWWTPVAIIARGPGWQPREVVRKQR